MRPDDLRDMLRQQPFRPFRLFILESGAERRVVIALLHITKLEPIITAPTSHGARHQANISRLDALLHG